MGRFGEEINFGLSLIHELADMASKNNQPALAQKLQNELKTLEGKFSAVLEE
ncbi:hypothetical protein D3C86_1239760 [compost metagenome]